MYKIQTLNNISIKGLERLPREAYEITTQISQPDAILVRSATMHEMEIPASLKAVGRAGAGVNNIPVSKLTQRGIPVFNAPGANANAVKELVLAALFLAYRNICPAWDYTRQLKEQGAELNKAVEGGKKRFAGFELPGRTLGVIGLGAIGVQVANAAQALGMRVIGFDPGITVKSAWQLSASVEQAASLDEVFAKADAISLHVPLMDATRELVNEQRLKLMAAGSVILNFSRDGIVDNKAVLEALDNNQLHAFVTDFPDRELLDNEKVIALPHLGASTLEAEENCAVMVANTLREYLEQGNIRYSVNFPEAVLPHTEGVRLCISNANVPNMVGQITTHLANVGLNILDMLNKSRNDIAYTMVDVDNPVLDDVVDAISSIEGVLKLRVLQN